MCIWDASCVRGLPVAVAILLNHISMALVEGLAPQQQEALPVTGWMKEVDVLAIPHLIQNHYSDVQPYVEAFRFSLLDLPALILSLAEKRQPPPPPNSNPRRLFLERRWREFVERESSF